MAQVLGKLGPGQSGPEQLGIDCVLIYSGICGKGDSLPTLQH